MNTKHLLVLLSTITYKLTNANNTLYMGGIRIGGSKFSQNGIGCEVKFKGDLPQLIAETEERRDAAKKAIYAEKSKMNLEARAVHCALWYMFESLTNISEPLSCIVESDNSIEFAGALYVVRQLNEGFGIGFGAELGYSFKSVKANLVASNPDLDYLRYNPCLRICGCQELSVESNNGLFARVGAAFLFQELVLLHIGAKFSSPGPSADKANSDWVYVWDLPPDTSRISTSLFADISLLIPLTDNVKAIFTFGISKGISLKCDVLLKANVATIMRLNEIYDTPEQKLVDSLPPGALKHELELTATTGWSGRAAFGFMYIL